MAEGQYDCNAATTGAKLKRESRSRVTWDTDSDGPTTKKSERLRPPAFLGRNARDGEKAPPAQSIVLC
jgi:hypothetical protein